MRILHLCIVYFFISSIAISAQSSIAFRELTSSDGLNDGFVNNMCQDKYGYMWFSSIGALNRFNGKTIKRFTHSRTDSNSAPSGICYAMACGPDGRLWIAYWDQLVEFNYETSSFRRIRVADGININAIIPLAPGKLYLSSTSGLRCYNTLSDRFESLTSKSDTATANVLQSSFYHASYHAGKIYLGGKGRFVVYDTGTRTATVQLLPSFDGKRVNKLMVDKSGTIWLSHYDGFQFMRMDLNTGKQERLDHLLVQYEKETQAIASNFISGQNHDLWIITNAKGLLHYDLKTGELIQYKNDYREKSSLLSNLLFGLYADKEGNIWIGTSRGVNYFHQERNMFRIIYPFPDRFLHPLARASEEDHHGNLWFTTGQGFSCFNPKTNSYKVWQNQPGKKEMIYYNSVRGIAEDSNHDIWAATGAGINRVDPVSGKVDFITAKEGAPVGFYFSLNKTSDGTLWFGTRDNDGLYYYIPRERKFHSVAEHPILSKYKRYPARMVFQDSKGRIWIGYNGSGLVLYDKQKGITRHWMSTDSTDNTIADDVIASITEDLSGIIWVTTFNGITSIDPNTYQFRSFTQKDGLKSNIIGGVAVDDKNRLWFGTGAGLAMLDESRLQFTYFGPEMGLYVTDFNEHNAFKLSTGELMMPSSQGYVTFDPSDYIPGVRKLPCFISSIHASPRVTESVSRILSERELVLAPDENFFTIELEAINFSNPAQTWYAYKLDGLENEWHYTQDPKAVYTSVPGGKYTFRYKATDTVNNWEVEEKTLAVHIGTIFYKATWFWIMIVILVISMLILFYRFRMRKQKQILLLETKAGALEKEKTIVQYESLKQHLNPHFLFNSLTSLRSLIKTDTKTATVFLDGMSKVYRYVLKSGEQELVRLQDELDFLKSFIQLQQIRFQEGLRVNIDVNASFLDKYIAPVTLQNLVENAIKHNTADRESPLVIDVFTEEQYVVVRNNLQRYRVVETSNKKGLASLQTLYRFYSDTPMVITEDQQYFLVKIPLL